MMLVAQANTAAYHGQLRESRKLIDNAVEMAKLNGEREVAAEYLAEAALREADVGESGYARRYAQQALTLAPGRDIRTLAALTFARVRDDRIAQGLADDLNQRFPANTILQCYWLPMVHASLELNRGNNSRAIEVLQRSSTYDLADAPPVSAPTFYPAYLRGSAYLAKGDGESAAAEYRKYLEHRAIVANLPLGALAYLGLGRAYALVGDIESSRTDYERFLSLWKDADPNLPVLKSARSEYALLRHR
jgi:tetratricopeptide (TPR) repeat protein